MLFKKYSLYFVFLCSFNAFYGMEKESANLEKLEEYKSLLKTLNNPKYRKTTSVTDRRKYGYNGTMIPIAKGHSFISSALEQAGYIIRKAQPSTWGGYFYMTSSVEKNCIFIEDNNLKYSAEIKNGENIQSKILASCVINNGSKNIMEHDIAILWKVAYQLTENTEEKIKFWKKPSEKKLYITQARLSQIQEQKNELKLDENKIEVN